MIVRDEGEEHTIVVINNVESKIKRICGFLLKTISMCLYSLRYILMIYYINDI